MARHPVIWVPGHLAPVSQPDGPAVPG